MCSESRKYKLFPCISWVNGNPAQLLKVNILSMYQLHMLDGEALVGKLKCRLSFFLDKVWCFSANHALPVCVHIGFVEKCSSLNLKLSAFDSGRRCLFISSANLLRPCCSSQPRTCALLSGVNVPGSDSLPCSCVLRVSSKLFFLQRPSRVYVQCVARRLDWSLAAFVVRSSIPILL